MLGGLGWVTKEMKGVVKCSYKGDIGKLEYKVKQMILVRFG